MKIYYKGVLCRTGKSYSLFRTCSTCSRWQLLHFVRLSFGKAALYQRFKLRLVGEGKPGYLPQDLRDILHHNIHINTVWEAAFGVLGPALGVLAAIGHIAVAAAPLDGADVHF